MDVGNPSNFERFLAARPQLNHTISAVSVSDEAIRAQIAADARKRGRIWCPHTATAAWAHAQLGADAQERPFVLVATAHPAKFREVVAPLVPEPVPACPALEAIAELPAHATAIAASLDALTGVLAEQTGRT